MNGFLSGGLRRSPRLSRAGGWGLACMAALLVGTAPAQAMDDPPGRVGRIGESQGRVWMLESGQGEWMDAQRNRPFTTGDRLSTEPGARMELDVGSTTLRLGGGSELQVLRLDDDRIELQLISGSLALRAREFEVAREIGVQTAEGLFAPRVAGLYRVDREGRGSFGAALSGELQFDARDSALQLRAGQRAEFWVDPADQLTHFTWASLPRDDFAWWVQREDARDEQVAQRGPVSPEMTGARDLDRHGRWSSHPEYGSIWTPTSVAVGWAPYRYGRWAWVSPWGWTWVDDAPWGFAPFHYGRWVFFAGQWCWAPGQFVRRPVYAPAMVAWVGGAAPGVSVSVSVGPTVGWIPLAPREVYYPSYRYSPRYWEHVNSPYGRLPPRPEPHAPVMYSNRGVPGGVTMVPAQALAQRQPVLVAPRRLDDGAVRQVLRDEPVRVVAPPAPAEVRVVPRVAPAPGAVVPRPPVGTATGTANPRPMPGAQPPADGALGNEPRRATVLPRDDGPAASGARPQPASPAQRVEPPVRRLSPSPANSEAPVRQMEPVQPAPRQPELSPRERPTPSVPAFDRVAPPRPATQAQPVRPAAPRSKDEDRDERRGAANNGNRRND